jgi:hypothetical protein
MAIGKISEGGEELRIQIVKQRSIVRRQSGSDK